MNAAIFVIVTMCILTFFGFGYIAATGKDYKGTVVLKGQRYLFTCATFTSLVVIIAVFVLGSTTVVEYLNQWLVAWFDITHAE